MDLGIYMFPTMYSLRHARGYGRSALRNWLLQVILLCKIISLHCQIGRALSVGLSQWSFMGYLDKSRK